MAACESRAEADEKWDWIDVHLFSKIRNESDANPVDDGKKIEEFEEMSSSRISREEREESLEWMMSVLKGILLSLCFSLS